MCHYIPTRTFYRISYGKHLPISYSYSVLYMWIVILIFLYAYTIFSFTFSNPLCLRDFITLWWKDFKNVSFVSILIKIFRRVPVLSMVYLGLFCSITSHLLQVSSSYMRKLFSFCSYIQYMYNTFLVSNDIFLLVNTYV